jgi:hypothetical protein
MQQLRQLCSAFEKGRLSGAQTGNAHPELPIGWAILPVITSGRAERVHGMAVAVNPPAPAGH